MTNRTRTAASTALVLLLAVPSAALAKGGDLSIRSVSSANHVTPGEPLPIEIRVRRAGRTPAARVGFYLSANTVRDKDDVRLDGPKIRGGRKQRINAEPQVPAAQPLGTYHLIACVDGLKRNNCRTAKSTFEVTRARVGTKELVDAAVAAHRLTPQEGLYYRALAAVGDGRLPAAYAGDPADVQDGIMREVLVQWPTLSRAQQATLAPYFAPPTTRRARQATSAAVGSTAPDCATREVPTQDWRSLAMPHGHVRVWWLASEDDRIGPRARSFVSEIENHMWPRLVALLGREPILDSGQRCYHGIDDKLDIYMWGLDKARALTIPYPPNCKATPAFIVFDARSQLPQRWEVAHELFHAFQFSYNYKGACASYANWDEAAATWAGNYLYPQDDYEHKFGDFMTFTHSSFADASYDGWVFPYAMTQLHGVGTMKAIYDQTLSQPGPLQAINAAVPGGFKDSWPEFARLAWNQDPIETGFHQWDRFDAHPAEDPWPTGPWIVPWHIGAGDAGQTEVDVKIPEQPLSRVYRALKFDPDVTAVTGFTPYNTNLHVDAIMKLADGTTKTEDWSKRRLAVMCPEAATQRVEDLLLVASNTSMDAPLPADPPVKVVATNLGCSRYTGTVTGVEHVHAPNVNTTETWTAHDLVFKRTPSGDDNPAILFDLVAGSVTWSISGNNQGCEISSGPVELPIKDDGSNGDLGFETWLGDHPTRRYSGLGYNLPQVTGTAKCQSGTYTWTFGPHTFFDTLGGGMVKGDVPPDGILEGSITSDEHAGGSRDVTYSWHLVPES